MMNIVNFEYYVSKNTLPLPNPNSADNINVGVEKNTFIFIRNRIPTRDLSTFVVYQVALR